MRLLVKRFTWDLRTVFIFICDMYELTSSLGPLLFFHPRKRSLLHCSPGTRSSNNVKMQMLTLIVNIRSTKPEWVEARWSVSHGLHSSPQPTSLSLLRLYLYFGPAPTAPSASSLRCRTRAAFAAGVRPQWLAQIDRDAGRSAAQKRPGIESARPWRRTIPLP